MPKMAAKKEENETLGEYSTKTSRSDKADDQHTALSSEEEMPHPTHQFRFHFCQKTSKTSRVVCAGRQATIGELLQSNDNFKHHEEQQTGKEFVILRHDSLRQKDVAICRHYPCHLISDDELLKIKFVGTVTDYNGINTTGKHGKKPTGKQIVRPTGSHQDIVEFHVATKGGKSVVNDVIQNANLRKLVSEVIVYAFRGETIHRALKRDGRFNEAIFKKITLCDQGNDCDNDLSYTVDTFHGKCFQVVKKTNPPSSQDTASSLEYVEENDSQTSQTTLSDEKSDSPQEPTTEKPFKGEMPEQKETLPGETTKAELSLHAIPDNGKILKILREQFASLYKIMKDREQGHKATEMQKLLSVEYGKNVETCMRVKAVKELIKYSDSVCQIRVKGKAEGSGFLLFDRFIITNGHVIREIYDRENKQLKDTVTAAFNFEDLNINQDKPLTVKKQVVAFADSFDESGYHDFALLEAKRDNAQTMPPGLPWRVGSPPQRGGICIIGHPNGGVKKMDPCLIIPFEDRSKAVNAHTHAKLSFEQPHHMNPLITPAFFKEYRVAYAEKNDKNRITYDTCFYHGSSGSPVFDEFCKVIGMHSGGFPYKTSKGKTQSIIEFALPISSIIDEIRHQLEQNGNQEVLDLLEKCNSNHCQEEEKFREGSEGNDEIYCSQSQESMEVDGEALE